MMEKRYLLFKKWFGFIAPFVFAVLATGIKLSCFRHTGYSVPFLLYFLAMLVSGCLGGSRSATIALIAIAVCIFRWLMPLTDGVGKYTLAELLLFFSEGGAVALLFWWNERGMRRLDESEQKYRRIIDQGAEAFFLCDAECQITLASTAASRLLLREKQSVPGTLLHELVHSEDQAAFDLTRLRLLTQGEGTALLQQRILCGNGEWRWTECCINNLLNDPLVSCMIIQMRDITHRVNQQRHQEDFVNMASHELKSPVTAIRGFLHIARNRWTEGKVEDHPHYMERIHAQTDKLLGLIDDMLNMTRINAGELAYHFEQVDLAVCLREAAAAVKAGIPGRKIELDLQSGLPAVQADPVRIGQVVTNLLSNAFKYSPEHAPVKLTLTQNKEWLEVHVSDHGIGIPADALRRVFDRFYRVDSLPKGKYEGLGLGLFIASRIIHQHEGHIWVNSEEGKGAVFSFSLPLRAH